MKKLPFSQHGMLSDLLSGKPFDYSYPNGYRWITVTIRALKRKGLVEGSEHQPSLTLKGEEYCREHVRLRKLPPGNKHPIAKFWYKDSLYATETDHID